MNQVERNLSLIIQKIEKARKTYSHNDKTPTIIAVSKTVATENIVEAINGGCTNFGENYIKEAEEKWPALKIKYPQIKLHFIGHLQSNKAAQALDLFDCIHSLDSEKLAMVFQKEIAKKKFLNQNNLAKINGAKANNTDLIIKNSEFFIQINIGEEEQKSGIAPKQAKSFINFAKQDCGLNVTGLMCVPPSNEAASPYFALLAKIAKENNLNNLSMGMTADYEEAIALGATHLRLGTAIFGKREL